ncbi:MAG TPA: hypothetical protein VN258_15870 [Mobilitalea sp.]|nr:hypothetical protein [Mobilitalea sp.]
MNPYSGILELSKKEGTPAQEAIRTTFLQLYAKEAFTDINVKSLCELAPVARTTFYSYYSNTDELLVEIEDGLIVDILKNNEAVMYGSRFDDHNLYFFENALQYVNANHAILYALLIVQPDIRFIEKWKTAIKYHFWELLFSEKEIKSSRLILEMIASMAISAFAYWLKNPQDINVPEVNRIVSLALKSLNY